MKKIIRHLCIAVSVCMLTMLSICGCGKEKEETPTTEEPKVTVTFMNGETKLGEVSIKSGDIIDASEYEKYQSVDGMEFEAWYEAPSFIEASRKDLTKDTFSDDVTLYGKYKADNISEDTRNWYIVGESAEGSLKNSSWAGSVDDDVKELFLLKSTGKNTNEYSITIDLYEGDKFQIIHDWQWDGQHGYGYFSEPDASWVESGGGFAGTDAKANVLVTMSGSYTITLTTNPDNEADDVITIVRNGDVTGRD